MPFHSPKDIRSVGTKCAPLAWARKVAVSATPAGWAKCPRYVFALALSCAPVLAETLPSGKSATLHEVLTDTVGTEAWLRFRFIAPEITKDADINQTADDMIHLCTGTALPYRADFDLAADVIVISIADRVTEFGVADPDATQFFEAFRVRDNACIWESL